MKKILLLTIALLSLNTFATCPDSILKAHGFKVESNSFKQNSKMVLKWLKKSEDQFVDDVETRYYSTQYRGYVLFNSYDHLGTDTMEMFGDAIVIRDLSTFEVVEVRWYKNGQKYISYNGEVQQCASDLVPLADNALF